MPEAGSVTLVTRVVSGFDVVQSQNSRRVIHLLGGDLGGRRLLLAPMPQDHVNRDNQQEDPEHATQQIRVHLGGPDGPQGRAEEEAESEEPPPP